MHTTTFIPAHRLLAERDNNYWRQYWGSEDCQFYLDSIGAMIDAINESGAKRVFLISKDRAWFLAGFFAVLYAGRPVVLPQSDAPELLMDLMTADDVLLGDQNELSAFAPKFIPMKFENFDGKRTFQPLDPTQSQVIYYTSGSSSQPKAIEKKLIHLEAEAKVLHDMWGCGQGKTFLSTVSHHHLYAFLYSLLWPVCAGFQISRHTYTYWGDLLAASAVGDYIISSPAHLGRFSLLEECAPKSFSYVFSSGAPLDFDSAALSKKHLGTLPIEVYGSTETGGIAYRRQEEESTPWKRFDCVALSCDANNKLSVKSPYIDDEAGYQTQDMVSWNDDQTFHLLGRADRIIKVEGKRVSLFEIENKLIKTAFVADAAVLLLKKAHRDELGAVVVLSQLGQDKLTAVGRLAFTRELRKILSLYFDAVLIPRKWRFVDAIPTNAQGKRLPFVLKKLFEAQENPTLGPVRQPVILQQHIAEDRAEFVLNIPQDLAYFNGHFNTMPILPGVVQLHWAVALAKKTFGLEGHVVQGNQIKFTNVIRPHDDVTLILEYNREKSSISYAYKKDSVYSSGRLNFSKERCDA